MSLQRFPATEPDLAILVSSAPEKVLREAARVAVQVAVKAALVDSAAVTRAIELLSRGSFGETPDRKVIQTLWESLDERAWILAEAESPEYPRVFAQARAVNALWYALDMGARTAAEGALYEALHALADSSALRIELLRILSGSND